MKKNYNVSGMSCAACKSRVEKSVQNLNGVSEVSVNLLKNSMVVDYDANTTSDDEIIKAVKKSGYGAELIENEKKAVKSKNNDDYKIMKNKVILTFIFTIPLFYLSMGHMMNWPLPGIFLGVENAMIFGLTQIILLIPILMINIKYFKNGFKALFHLSPNMDSLVAIGASAAVIYGIYALYKIAFGLGHNDLEMVHTFMHDLYFESAGTILALISLGKLFEARAKGKTSEAITKLMDLSPKMATIINDGKEETISIDDVKLDDIIVCKSGEAIACDGIIIEGEASVDESMITGEGLPVDKSLNDKVIGATINKAGYIKFKATAIKGNTTLDNIIKLVDEATSSKAPIAKLADKIALYFVPIVISIAIISSIIWLITGSGLEFALSIGISILVVSCPCALGLATPTAIMVGTGRGASIGVLIKSAEALEQLHSVNTVILDKTGTITKGIPSVTDIIALGISDEKLLSLAGGIEEKSSHPLSKAVVRKMTNENIKGSIVEDFKNIPGKGILGKIDNKTILAGNIKLMNENNIIIDNSKINIEEYINDGKTPLYYAYDGILIGLIFLADEIKETSKEAIKLLQSKGIHVIMLTGDHKKTALAIQKKIGVDEVIAEVLPEDKEATISQIQSKGNLVAMVGDGINDAIALAKADVGIAIGAGTDVAIESADIVLMKNDLLDVYNAIALSKATIKNIKENLFWAFIYNIIGIPVACGIFYGLNGFKLNPMIAALCMGFSSIFVVANALRLRMFKIKTNEFKKDNKKEEKIEEKMEDKKMKKEIKIEGMMCQNCVKHVKHALEGIEGLELVEVNLENKNAIVIDNLAISDSVIKNAIEDAGYNVLGISTYEG